MGRSCNAIRRSSYRVMGLVYLMPGLIKFLHVHLWHYSVYTLSINCLMGRSQSRWQWKKKTNFKRGNHYSLFLFPCTPSEMEFLCSTLADYTLHSVQQPRSSDSDDNNKSLSELRESRLGMLLFFFLCIINHEA